MGESESQSALRALVVAAGAARGALLVFEASQVSEAPVLRWRCGEGLDERALSQAGPEVRALVRQALATQEPALGEEGRALCLPSSAGGVAYLAGPEPLAVEAARRVSRGLWPGPGREDEGSR